LMSNFLFTHNLTLISGKAIFGFYFYICLNKKSMNIIVSEKIKRLRKAKGLSQEEMADKLHISQSAYARIETGESQSWATHLEKLSEIFEVRPESFFIDDANNFNNQNQEQNGGMAFQFVGTINTINS